MYEAWSNIIYSLIPNADLIHKHLTDFMTITEAEEVVIFEKATFLVRLSLIVKNTHTHSYTFNNQTF